MTDLAAIYGIDPEDFNLTPEAFDHQSKLHGIGHVYRVMIHCLELGLSLNFVSEARLAFFAAYIHDLSRKHDGRCMQHGSWAANEKLPLYGALFTRYGIGDKDLEHIRTAIVYHSMQEELPFAHPSWRVTAILKDADALDRIRLGESDLDPGYLRFKETLNRIGFARELYFATYGKPLKGFSEVISLGI